MRVRLPPRPPGKIFSTVRLEVVELQVKNWSEMLDWRVGKFGLKIIAREDDHQFALLAGDGGAMLGLFGENGKTEQKLTPYFKSENFEKTVAGLKSQYINVGAIEVRHWGKRAKVKDPEGNIIYLYEERIRTKV